MLDDPKHIDQSRCVIIEFQDGKHGYIKKHGRSSWELDALDPPVIERLIETAINTVIDKPLFEQAKQEQLEARKKLETAAENWSQVQEFIETL